MFSPYYRRARDRGTGDVFDHCAVNVALYGQQPGWAMTERGRGALARDAHSLAIGPSALVWDGHGLTVTIDERAAPLPSRVRGTVRLVPTVLPTCGFDLDVPGRHRWRPIAPRATVTVDFTHPRVKWRGEGYLDTNAGDEPLEDGFARWHWSRASVHDGTVILYDVVGRGGRAHGLALHCDATGRVTSFAAPAAVALPRSGWGIERTTRSDDGRDALLVRTLLDAPFYARSLVSSRLRGQPVLAMHESLSLDRFCAGWVRWLLPFRMRRAP